MASDLLLDGDQQDQYWALGQQPEQAASFLSQALNLPEAKHDARQAITVDYASYALSLARQLKLSHAQTGTLLEVAGAALAAASGGSSLDNTQALIKERLMAHCSARPGPGSASLTAEHIARIAQFFATTLLQHFSLYVHAFTREQEHEQYTARLMVETAVVRPSLAAALPEADWLAAREAEAAAKVAAEEAAAAAELERLRLEAEAAEAEAKAAAAAARQEQLTKKPATLAEAVDQLVAQRLEEERAALAAHYQQLEAGLVGRLEALQAAAAPPAAPGKK